MPLDIYVRVSRVGGREGDCFISTELQEEKCRALAQARGLDVGQVFIDLDRSGGKMDRPEFKKVLARIEGQVSGGVIVARIDSSRGRWSAGSRPSRASSWQAASC
jgi:DNA invertase Pin-like site-specific DNA recombinase